MHELEVEENFDISYKDRGGGAYENKEEEKCLSISLFQTIIGQKSLNEWTL